MGPPPVVPTLPVVDVPSDCLATSLPVVQLALVDGAAVLFQCRTVLASFCGPAQELGAANSGDWPNLGLLPIPTVWDQRQLLAEYQIV
jgi:hypothetical protein